MSDEMTITILGQGVDTRNESISIYDLKYLKKNPRVYSSIHRKRPPENSDELQKFIEKEMLKQPSVIELLPDIEAHGGLLEPILVRIDTKEVIEGNSRLASYRKLHDKTKDEKWAIIPCICVASLTNKQQDAYLSQIHIKGKTSWTTYEKANLAYIRNQEGMSVEEIAQTLSETPGEIKKRIAAIQLMTNNNDNEKPNFSYYNVLIRTRSIYEKTNYTPEVQKTILGKVKSKNTDFTALELRTKMPAVLGKKRALKTFLSGQSTLDDAFQNARPSSPRKKIQIARDKISDINQAAISKLDKSEINALLPDVKKLRREIERIQKMVEKEKERYGQ